MPTFTRKDGRYFISYVTGPSHVLLGLSFGPASTYPTLVRLPHPGHCDHGQLDEARIREAVMAGVTAAAVQLHPVEIVYCDGDAPRYDIYQHCGCVLAQRVSSGAEFIET